VLVLGGIIFGLHHALARIGPRDVLNALEATPRHEIIHALELTAGSLCVMCCYDLPGIFFAYRLPSVPRLAFRRISLASFCAFALSHVLGAPALSAAAIRLRLYAQWGVPPSGIGRIVALSASTFSLGIATMLGGTLALHPSEFPAFGHALPPLALRAIGALLWFGLAAYLAAARTKASLNILGRTIPLPGLILAIAQITLGCLDIALAGGILYAVLPDAPGLSFARVMTVYLAAFASGLFSGLPGGVGVFDTVLLFGLSGFLPPATAIGAILLFRVLYFLLPACIAALCYAVHEIWLTTKI
jgi:uncharacterized membrane protein YbhN (UPF0104 family)